MPGRGLALLGALLLLQLPSSSSAGRGLKHRVHAAALRRRSDTNVHSNGHSRRMCELDLDGYICKRGDVRVLVDIWSSNQRLLRFDGDCAVESTVNCKGSLPKSGQGVCEEGKCGSCPCEYDASQKLNAPYMQTMFDNLHPWCTSGQPSRALLIGLGAGELPQYLMHHCPDMTVDAVELSGDVISTAREYFGLGLTETAFAHRLTVEQNDGLSALAERSKVEPGSYDAVLVDCFTFAGEVPDQCRSKAFAERVKSVLRPSGVLLQNIWHKEAGNPRVAEQFNVTLATYAAVFPGGLEDVHVPPAEEDAGPSNVEVIKAMARYTPDVD